MQPAIGKTQKLRRSAWNTRVNLFNRPKSVHPHSRTARDIRNIRRPGIGTDIIPHAALAKSGGFLARDGTIPSVDV